MFEKRVFENRYGNQIYPRTRTQAKISKYLVLNGNISPENKDMEMMILNV